MIACHVAVGVISRRGLAGDRGNLVLPIGGAGLGVSAVCYDARPVAKGVERALKAANALIAIDEVKVSFFYEVAFEKRQERGEKIFEM